MAHMNRRSLPPVFVGKQCSRQDISNPRGDKEREGIKNGVSVHTEAQLTDSKDKLMEKSQVASHRRLRDMEWSRQKKME